MGETAGSSTNAIAEAMARLGVTTQMSWREVRGAYHERIREVHPDVADTAAANQLSGELNRALEVLRDATNSGARPLPQVEAGPPAPRLRSKPFRQDVMTMHASPGDVFVQLLEAAHGLGAVSYMDPAAGLIQVLLEDGPAAPQLLIAVDQSVNPPLVEFTLDSMNADHAPDIHDVVKQIAANIS